MCWQISDEAAAINEEALEFLCFNQLKIETKFRSLVKHTKHNNDKDRWHDVTSNETACLNCHCLHASQVIQLNFVLWTWICVWIYISTSTTVRSWRRCCGWFYWFFFSLGIWIQRNFTCLQYCVSPKKKQIVPLCA